jgi:hypothetical protein
MLSKKLVALFTLLAPHLFLLGLIVVFIFLKEAPPKVASFPKKLSSSDPLTITFNKPLKTETLDGKVLVFHNENPVDGTLEATPLALVFTPKNPWQGGDLYTVKIAPFAPVMGTVFSKPLENSFTIQKEKLIFIGPDERLMEGDPETGETKAITPDTMQIADFSLGNDGRFAAIYVPKENRQTNGLLFGKYEDGKYKIMPLPAQKETGYSHIHLCNGTKQLLLTASKEKDKNDALQYFDLLWEKNETKITQGFIVNDALVSLDKDATCSQDTARVVYRNTDNAFVSNFLGENNKDLVGVFDVTLGFSPRDTTLAFQKSLTEVADGNSYRSELSLYSSSGEVSILSESDTLFKEMSWNGTGTRFAVLYIAGQDYASRVEIYTQNETAWDKIFTIPATKERRFTYEALSPDGTSLALETASEKSTRVPTENPEIQIWDLAKNNPNGVIFQGKSPQWKK